MTVGPCALEYTKMKTADHFWTDPSADELVQRHRIHGGHCRQDSPTKRPALCVSVKTNRRLLWFYPICLYEVFILIYCYEFQCHISSVSVLRLLCVVQSSSYQWTRSTRPVRQHHDTLYSQLVMCICMCVIQAKVSWSLASGTRKHAFVHMNEWYISLKLFEREALSSSFCKDISVALALDRPTYCVFFRSRSGTPAAAWMNALLPPHQLVNMWSHCIKTTGQHYCLAKTMCLFNR